MNPRFDPRNIIHEYNKRTKAKFNRDVFEKKDQDLIDAMVDNILSIQRNQNFMIKILDITVEFDHEKIEKILKTIVKHGTYRKEDFPITDSIDLEDSEYYLMVIKYYIQTNSGDKQGMTLDVPILLPKIVNKYYFKIDNTYYYPMYLVGDYAVYNNSYARKKPRSKKYDPCNTYITLFTPIRFRKMARKLKTIDGEDLPCSEFIVNVFSKSINAYTYTAAKMGLYQALYFHYVDSVVISEELKDIPTSYCFKISPSKLKSETGDIYVYVDKYLYDNNPVVQSDIYGLITGINSYKYPFKFNEIFSHEFWTILVGMNFSNDPTLDKSYNILKSLERIYDLRSFKKMKLPEKDKRTTYHIIFWVMREFDELFQRDRIDLSYKRIQWAESIAFIYSKRVTDNIYNRLSIKGDNVKLEDIEKAIKMKPMMILKRLKKHFTLVAYSDLVNDLDWMIGLKYSLKGNSGGSSNSKLPARFSNTHPSHIGRLDLDSSPKSDPGMSGILTPLVNLYGEYKCFSDYQEPNEFFDTYKNDYRKHYEESLGTKVYSIFDDGDDFDRVKMPTIEDELLGNTEDNKIQSLFEDYVPEEGGEEIE